MSKAKNAPIGFVVYDKEASQDSKYLESFVNFIHQPAPPPNSYLALLGMEPQPIEQLLASVLEGLDYEVVRRFQEVFEISQRDAFNLLQIPNTTMSRRKEKGRLQSDESDRVLRYLRLLANAIELFEGNAPAARRWLQKPKRALGNVAPLQMAQTELGAREVEKLIDRLEEGVFS